MREGGGKAAGGGGKALDCLGKGEIASWRTQKFRGKAPVINNLGYG